MLVTYELLLFFDFKKKEIVREYNSEDLVEAIKIDNTKFRLGIKDRKLNNKEGHIDLEAEGSNNRIVT